MINLKDYLQQNEQELQEIMRPLRPGLKSPRKNRYKYHLQTEGLLIM